MRTSSAMSCLSRYASPYPLYRPDAASSLSGPSPPPAQLGIACLLITNAPVLMPWESFRTHSVLHSAPKDMPIHVRQGFLSELDLQLPSWLSRFLLHRTICMRSWIGTLCLEAGPSGSLT